MEKNPVLVDEKYKNKCTKCKNTEGDFVNINVTSCPRCGESFKTENPYLNSNKDLSKENFSDIINNAEVTTDDQN